MKYKTLIDPELKGIAKRIPYNRAIIKPANLYQAISFRLAAVPQEAAHRRITLEGYQGLKLKVDVFEPRDGAEKLPCLLYVHGGAFSYKAAVYHKKLAALYAVRGGCRVYFPDYHLTPKYPYPAAYEDVLAVYRYITGHSEALGVDAERIGVAGDSAGGAIAALLCGRYEQEGLKRPRLQMLVYPLTDVTMGTDSMKRYWDTPLWNAKSNRRMWDYYCGGLKGDAVYGASPMHSPLPRVLPDAYIETAEYDCLHDEGILYGKRLREAGAKVEINETRGTIHGYDSALNTNIAAENLKKRLSFLKRKFYGESSL